MPLILTLTHLDGTGHRETRTVSKPTFTIGRASGNDWILPDPDRHLSKTHCLISAEGGRYVLTDVSTNGVFVNGSRQAAGRDTLVSLMDGDEFRLGDYSVSVSESAGEETQIFGAGTSASASNAFGSAFGSGLSGQGGFAPSPAHDPFGSGSANAYGRDEGPLDADPLLDPFGASPSPAFHHPQIHAARTERAIDPFDTAEEESHKDRSFEDDDLFAPKDESWKGPSQADNIDAQHHAFAAPKVLPPVDFSTIDFDDLLGDMPPPGAAPATATPAALPGSSHKTAPAANFDDLSLDDLLGDAPAGSPPVPVAVAPASPPAAPRPEAQAAAAPASAPVSVVASPVSVLASAAPAAVTAPNPFDEGDLDGLLSTPPERPVAPVSAPPLSAPPLSALAVEAAQAPGHAPDPAPVVAPARKPAAEAAVPSANAGDAAALWAVFLEGAGVPGLKAGQEDPEAAMRAAGSLFRVMVEGVREVLMSRAAIKSEMRVEQTVIRARDNNALKFSITPDEAVSAMLMPDRTGYKAPLDASREAFADIKSHELAVMAGMQTALLSLLKRFDPGSIEKRLQPGKLDGFLPGARKARIWELFCATYKELAKEAEDDFQSVFGNEFARAYDAQMRKFE